MPATKWNANGTADMSMVERRKKARSKEHPLARKVKLRPKGPALERRRAARTAASSRPERERITLLLNRSLIERLRNAVYWTPGMTLARLVAESLEATITSMEAERGAPFPRREHELKIGRPAK